MSERERKVCQERERASREKQRDAIADVGSGSSRLACVLVYFINEEWLWVLVFLVLCF